MEWRKSTYSGSNGGDCIEVGWRKSSFSGSNGGQCVEVGKDSVILVRDTTDRDGGTLAFSATTWQDFLTRVR
jgi:hypothetical protein